jgi:hypothetical protein
MQTQKQKFVCPYCKFIASSENGLLIHTSKKHKNINTHSISTFTSQQKTNTTIDPNITNDLSNNYPDFLFAGPDEKELFLYLKKLQDDGDEQLCGKTALYLLHNNKFVESLKKIADQQTPLYIKAVGDVLSDIAPKIDRKVVLIKEIQSYDEKLMKIQEDYNALVHEVDVKQKQADELKDVEQQIALKQQDLQALSERFDSKKIDKVLIGINEIVNAKFVHNQQDNYYIIAADNYKSLSYLVDRLIVLYGKKRANNDVN